MYIMDITTYSLRLSLYGRYMFLDSSLLTLYDLMCIVPVVLELTI